MSGSINELWQCPACGVLVPLTHFACFRCSHYKPPDWRRTWRDESFWLHSGYKFTVWSMNRGVEPPEGAELTRLRELLAEAHEVLEAYAPNHPIVDQIADTDWYKVHPELVRLRGIEKAIRECPTTSADGIKALIYTTELRDALD